MSAEQTADVTRAQLDLATRVDRERIAEVLASLIEHPSVTGSERHIQDWIASHLRDLGAAVERNDPEPADVAADPAWPGSEVPRAQLPIVAGRLGRRGGRRILMVGHVDVVPIGDEAAWSRPAWSATRDGDRIYGRGSCDMKGGCAAILEALRVLAESGSTERWGGELVAVFVPSEEDGGQGSLGAIRSGWTADAAIITEPTDLAIVVAHAGAITFRLTVTGLSAHASTRRTGVSALEKFELLHRALIDDEARRNGAEANPLMRALGLPYATSIGIVHGGAWSSNVMDRLVAEGRYGVRLGQTSDEAAEELRACLSAAGATDPWLSEHTPEVEIVGGRFDSASIASDDPLVTHIRSASGVVLGREPALAALPAGTDMRLFVNEGGTPTVLFGPGSVHVAHSADEYVPLSEVVDCARVLVAWAADELAIPTR